MFTKKLLNILLVLFLAVLIAALDISIIGPALPSIQKDFAIDDNYLSWVFGIYILFQLLGAPILAKFSDRYGRKNIFIFCVSFFGIASLIVAFSTDFIMLLFGRLLQGFSAGGILPISTAIIADTFPAKHRGKALGMIGAIFGLAFLLGPLLGALLLNFSWKWLFLVNIPLVIFICLKSQKVIPNEAKSTKISIDIAGLLFLFLTLGTFALAISKIDSANFLNSLMTKQISFLIIISILSFVMFFLSESRAKDPIISLDILLSRQLIIIWFIAIVTGLVEAGMIFLPTIAIDHYNILDTTASLMMLPLVIALIIGSLGAGVLSDNLSTTLIIQASLLLLIFSFIFISYSDLSYVIFYSSGVMIGLAIAGLMTSLRVSLISRSNNESVGSNQGILALFLSIGRLLGASLVGAIMASEINSVVGFQKALLFCSGLIGVALIISANLKYR